MGRGCGCGPTPVCLACCLSGDVRLLRCHSEATVTALKETGERRLPVLQSSLLPPPAREAPCCWSFSPKGLRIVPSLPRVSHALGRDSGHHSLSSAHCQVTGLHPGGARFCWHLITCSCVQLRSLHIRTHTSAPTWAPMDSQRLCTCKPIPSVVSHGSGPIREDPVLWAWACTPL